MIQPDPSPETAPYWQAAHRGEFWLRYCAGCGRWLHPRMTYCCHGVDLVWRVASGRGRLVSYAVVPLALQPALAAQVPYTITYTRTEEGPLLVSAIPGAGHELHIGMPMRIVFDAVRSECTLPRFVSAS